MHIPASVSEDHGIAKLNEDDLSIYSVGISTGGIAEIRMAQKNPACHIIASTIDKKGLEFAKKHINEQGFGQQVEVKNEDVAKPLAYKDAFFDYVYARLVLHYLPEQDLIDALFELHRILRPGGKLFVVVRSTKSPAALLSDSTFDPVTHLTTYTYEKLNGKPRRLRRFFHSEESISKYVKAAGFTVQYVKSYEEQLFIDFMRTIKAPRPDNVIELLATK